MWKFLSWKKFVKMQRFCAIWLFRTSILGEKLWKFFSYKKSWKCIGSILCFLTVDKFNLTKNYLFVIFRNWNFIFTFWSNIFIWTVLEDGWNETFFSDIQALCLMLWCGLCRSDMHNAHLSSLQVTAILEKE